MAGSAQCGDHAHTNTGGSSLGRNVTVMVDLSGLYRTLPGRVVATRTVAVTTKLVVQVSVGVSGRTDTLKASPATTPLISGVERWNPQGIFVTLAEALATPVSASVPTLTRLDRALRARPHRTCLRGRARALVNRAEGGLRALLNSPTSSAPMQCHGDPSARLRPPNSATKGRPRRSMRLPAASADRTVQDSVIVASDHANGGLLVPRLIVPGSRASIGASDPARHGGGNLAVADAWCRDLDSAVYCTLLFSVSPTKYWSIGPARVGPGPSSAAYRARRHEQLHFLARTTRWACTTESWPRSAD